MCEPKLGVNSGFPSVIQVFVEVCDMNTVFLVLVLDLFHAGRVSCWLCLMPFFYSKMILHMSHKMSLS